MSEVLRYLIQKTQIGTMMKPNPEGNWIAAKDFDRVTAERDAALAELAKQDRVLRSSVPEEHKACTSPVGAVQNYIGDLEQRLNAADERADVLGGLLREVVALDPRGEFLGWQLDGKIDAALKPAEPAKDEHVCTGCGSKGWTANCKECVPY